MGNLINYVPPSLTDPPMATRDIQIFAEKVEGYLDEFVPTIPALVERIKALQTRYSNIESRVTNLKG